MPHIAMTSSIYWMTKMFISHTIQQSMLLQTGHVSAYSRLKLKFNYRSNWIIDGSLKLIIFNLNFNIIRIVRHDVTWKAINIVWNHVWIHILMDLPFIEQFGLHCSLNFDTRMRYFILSKRGMNFIWPYAF